MSTPVFAGSSPRSGGAARKAGPQDVPLLYWAGAAWSLAIAASPGDPGLIADLPRCEALLRRALELQEDYDAGAIHEFFVAFEGSRSAAMGGSVERARSISRGRWNWRRGGRCRPW